LVEEDCVRDHLSYLDAHKSMGPDGKHPQVLRELADVIVEPMSLQSSKRARRRTQGTTGQSALPPSWES